VVLEKDGEDPLDRWCEKLSTVLHRVMKVRDILYLTKTKANWTCHILHKDGLLKHATEEKIEGISDGKTRKKTCSYWVTLRKREDTGNRKRKHHSALGLEEAMALSYDGLLNGHNSSFCERVKEHLLEVGKHSKSHEHKHTRGDTRVQDLDYILCLI